MRAIGIPTHQPKPRRDGRQGLHRVTIDELLDDYPYLEREDVMQALKYAAWLAQEREIHLDPAE